MPLVLTALKPVLTLVATMLAAVEGAAIDTGLVSELVALVKSVMGLFAEFPLNVLLIASLCFVAFGLFARAKRAAM